MINVTIRFDLDDIIGDVTVLLLGLPRVFMFRKRSPRGMCKEQCIGNECTYRNHSSRFYMTTRRSQIVSLFKISNERSGSPEYPMPLTLNSQGDHQK